MRIAVPGGTPQAKIRAPGALATLILGCLSAGLCGLFTSIPALIVGHRALKQIRQSRGRLEGEALIWPGLVLAYCGIVLWLVLIVGGVFAFRSVGKETAATEAGAIKAIREINEAEASYSRIYAGPGGPAYAGSLATLGVGPGPTCAGTGTAEYACLLSGPLSMPDCHQPQWCTLNKYKFQLLSHRYPLPRGQDYAITATPVDTGGIFTNFCSTSDGIVRTDVTLYALEAGYDAEACLKLAPVTESP